MKTKKIKLLLLFLILINLISCSFSPIVLGEQDTNDSISKPGDSYTNPSGPSYEIIQAYQPSIIIKWDTPDGTSPSSYKFYYRAHNDINWIYLTEINSTSTLELEVDYTTLNTISKDIDFGVSAIYSDGESLVHSSLDTTANPSSGWYVHWN